MPCIIEHCITPVARQICDLHWRLMPLAVRQRWWTETDYGRKPPSNDLKRTVRAAVGAALAAKEEP